MELIDILIVVNQPIDFLGYFWQVLVPFSHHYEVSMILLLEIRFRSCEDDYSICLWVNIDGVHFIVRWSVVRKS